jgi:hypothetical protein
VLLLRQRPPVCFDTCSGCVINFFMCSPKHTHTSKQQQQQQQQASFPALTGDGSGVAAPPGSLGNVVVIGAGVSGLAAACMLQNQGWRVTVLEARNRIGGSSSPVLPADASVVCGVIAHVRGPPKVIARVGSSKSLTLNRTQQPTNQPTSQPTDSQATNQSTNWLTNQRSGQSCKRSNHPTNHPTIRPSTQQTIEPSDHRTIRPSTHTPIQPPIHRNQSTNDPRSKADTTCPLRMLLPWSRSNLVAHSGRVGPSGQQRRRSGGGADGDGS